MQTRLYRHYKNKPYRYLGIVRHSETLEELVLYETIYENEIGRTWVRPKAMFFEPVEINQKLTPRFKLISFQFKISEIYSVSDREVIQKIYELAIGKFDEFEFNQRFVLKQQIYLQVAFDGQMPVAFNIGFAQTEKIFHSVGSAVIPEYRLLGLASVMTQNQLEWCKAKGILKVQTKVENQFNQMIRLNLNFGFEIIGTETDEKNTLQIIFEKNLN